MTLYTQEVLQGGSWPVSMGQPALLAAGAIPLGTCGKRIAQQTKNPKMQESSRNTDQIPVLTDKVNVATKDCFQGQRVCATSHQGLT